MSGPVEQLDEKLLSGIFPDYDSAIFTRPLGPVDILLGADYFSLHPKSEIATDGQNLSLMKGELGVCVQGYHPCLTENRDDKSLSEVNQLFSD